MSAVVIAQARQLARLRHARLVGATRRMAAARAATRAAEAAKEEARTAAVVADAALASARQGLAADPGEAERLLAVADRSRFAQAVAASVADEAAERLVAHAKAEAEHGRALLRAHLRHERLEDQLELLVRRRAMRDEERDLER